MESVACMMQYLPLETLVRIFAPNSKVCFSKKFSYYHYFEEIHQTSIQNPMICVRCLSPAYGQGLQSYYFGYGSHRNSKNASDKDQTTTTARISAEFFLLDPSDCEEEKQRANEGDFLKKSSELKEKRRSEFQNFTNLSNRLI